MFEFISIPLCLSINRGINLHIGFVDEVL